MRRHALAVRPGKPYPATFRKASVESRGIEPRLPPCHGGVFPLDHDPVWFLLVVSEPLTIPHFALVLLLETSPGVAHPPKRCTHRASNLSAAFSGGLSSSVHSGAPGNRTPITWVQAKCLPVRPASRCSQEVRPGIEPDPHPYQGRVLPKHLQTIE